MSTYIVEPKLNATFLAVFSLHEMPGVVAFDSTTDAIEFLESGSDLDDISPLGVVEWDRENHNAKGVNWQYSASISYGKIMASASQGYAVCQG